MCNHQVLSAMPNTLKLRSQEMYWALLQRKLLLNGMLRVHSCESQGFDLYLSSESCTGLRCSHNQFAATADVPVNYNALCTLPRTSLQLLCLHRPLARSYTMLWLATGTGLLPLQW